MISLPRLSQPTIAIASLAVRGAILAVLGLWSPLSNERKTSLKFIYSAFRRSILCLALNFYHRNISMRRLHTKEAGRLVANKDEASCFYDE